MYSGARPALRSTDDTRPPVCESSAVTVARWKLAWAALGLLLFTITFVFPVGKASGLALVVLVGLSGATLANLSARIRFSLPRWAPDSIIAGVICAASALLFKSSWNHSGFRIYDWAVHHAILKHLVDGLRQGHVPSWVHSVSTGDSPYDLYAFLPYYLAAKAALLTNTTDLTLVLVRSAVVIHSLAALFAAFLARRLVHWPWAIVVGLATLFDVGSVWGGGIEGLFAMGVTHSALAQAIWSLVLVVVLASLERPRLWKSGCIWALVALAVACHPLAIVSALASVAALGLVALLARDVPPQRALCAMLHVSVGVLLVAFVWMPFSERLLRYGVHYGIPPASAAEQLGHLLSQPVPEASVAALVYAGYLGILVGALSRRAAPTLLACFAASIMAGQFDQLYSLLDLVPSLETARFQMVRLPSAAKVPIYACAVYLVQSALARVKAPNSPLSRQVLAALLALGVFGVVRSGLPYLDQFTENVRWLASRDAPDSAGLRALISWAREQNQAMQPDRYGRLLDEDERRSFVVYHVNAESGLPTLWLGPTLPLLFLRERIEDASPSSLRRFNVRWVMRADRAPTRGDPATQMRFGRYFVRELPDWDGRFARVERGAGDVLVTRLDDERVDVELRNTNEPALVALGTGYYPRWQAQHDARGALPVYALPAFDGARLHVVSAWLPPGHTTFSPTGALPSDGKGRAPTALAGLLALSICVVWARLPRVKQRLLRALARCSAWSRKNVQPLGMGAAGVFALGALALGIATQFRPAPALQLGNGLWPGARVEVRSTEGSEAPWRRCRYAALYGAYRCPEQVLVQDSVTALLNDAPPSLPFVVPAIRIAASESAGEVRVSLRARLSGEYWAATNGPAITFSASGEAPAIVSGEQSVLLFGGSSEAREIILSAQIPKKKPLEISIVQRERLEPERGYISAPESSP
jgi:hypothetical protein